MQKPFSATQQAVSSHQNHRICCYFLQLIQLLVQFAAFSLGISRLPYLHCCWPWIAPQVLQPPKTGCPWMGATRHNLQHRVKTRPHSAPMSGIQSPSTAGGIPYSRWRSSATGASVFTCSIWPPYLLDTSTPACTRAVITTGLKPTLWGI